MKIAIIGLPGYIHDSYNKNIDNLFRGVGFNTGNLVYMHAVTQHIEDEKDFFGWKIDADMINNEYDALIFLAANQLHPDKDMSILAELFESLKIPSSIIGIGVQANNFSQKMVFKEGTLRFIDVIKEKCSHISTRGEFTADVLTGFGANNVIATGCPSNFINFDVNLGKKIIIDKENINSIVINNNLREDMYEFLSLLVDDKSVYKKMIIQEPKLFIDFCRNKINSPYSDQIIDTLQNTIMKKHSITEIESFATENLETFFNVEAWMEYLRRFSLSIGSRMHGNMLALQSEVPSIFVTHDSRLEELVNIMKLPHVSFEKVKKAKNLEEIISMVEYDADLYDNNRKKLSKLFCEIYSSHGISIKPALKNIAK